MRQTHQSARLRRRTKPPMCSVVSTINLKGGVGLLLRGKPTSSSCKSCRWGASRILPISVIRLTARHFRHSVSLALVDERSFFSLEQCLDGPNQV
jgi:hypothetical protein